MILPDIYKNMLIYNQHRNFSKIPFAIYADTKWLLEKIQTCDNNPETLSTTKISKHTMSRYP